MKPSAIVSALVAMSLTLGGPVFGQAEGNQEEQLKTFKRIQRANERQAQRDYHQRGQRGFVPPGHGGIPPGQRAYQPGPRGYPPYVQRGDRRWDGWGAGPDYRYHPGDRLAPEYRHHNYVVNDWRGHGLHAPPRGYQWVQVGGDYLLVAIATGIILQLILNN